MEKDLNKLDPKDVYGSTKMFVNQCQQMIDEWYEGDIGVTSEHKDVKNIVICGMGGSAYGAHVIKSMYENEISVPVVAVSDYNLPGFVNENTLVIVTSYSGTTEEVVACLDKAERKGAKTAGLTSGGEIQKRLNGKAPLLTFNPTNNPSTQPRLGTGYIVVGTLLIFKKLGLIKLSKEELQKAVDEVRQNQEEIEQKAKDIAEDLKDYIPVIFASEHLVGNAHILRNQFNETSKSFSAFEDIPELNHHLMEGLKNPEDKKIKVIFLKSSLYSETHKKRVDLTKDVVEKNGISLIDYKVQGSTNVSQMLTALSFGGFVTLFLAFLYKQDPSLIPWVDYFKEQLKK